MNAVWFIIAISLSLGAAPPQPAAYLPRLGPAPLRHEEPTRITLTLPPLLMEDAPPDPEGSLDVKFIGPPLPPSHFASVIPVESPRKGATNALAIAPLNSINLAQVKAENDPEPADLLFGTNQVASPLTAKMLVQFFQQNNLRTNNGTSILVPVGFTPPPAPSTALPSSTATYSTPRP